MEQDTETIGSVCLLGATLWTDYRIEGHWHLAMMHARDRMNDYRAIALQKKPWMRFVPEAAARIHDQSRAFLASALEAVSLPTVVLTHHLPHRNSIPPRFTGDLLNAAYASDLGDLIPVGRPNLWIHGRTHDNCEYRLHETRVVCNPRGYRNENGSFNSSLLIDLAASGEVPEGRM